LTGHPEDAVTRLIAQLPLHYGDPLVFACQAGSKLLVEEFGIEYDEWRASTSFPQKMQMFRRFAVSVDLDPSMVPDHAASWVCSPSEGAEGAAPGKGDGHAAPG
jgi:hypothetical protein